MNQMMLPPHLQHAVVTGLIRERHAEAAEARLASTFGRPLVGGLRHRLGRGLVLAGAAIAREGLVEGSGEPLAVRASAAVVGGEPCVENESLRPAA